MQNKNLEELEEKIGYCFRDKELLRTSMTHSSFSHECQLKKLCCNERLEFLGDAVLEITVSDYLYHQVPELSEGRMSTKRASIVCEPTLALCCRELDLGSYILMGRGEEHTGGRERDSILSDAMEALIGAIYLDGGITSAKEFINRFILNDIDNKTLFYDSKSILQEWVQARGKGPLTYYPVSEKGPDHAKTFTVEARLGDEVMGTGSGRSKKAAEQEAAYHAILRIRQTTDGRKDITECI
ncbi:MAG: ribonuclease III [Alistipes sp.]|nr:ribonuclease III [Alistipes sp.]